MIQIIFTFFFCIVSLVLLFAVVKTKITSIALLVHLKLYVLLGQCEIDLDVEDAKTQVREKIEKNLKKRAFSGKTLECLTAIIIAFTVVLLFLSFAGIKVI